MSHQTEALVSVQINTNALRAVHVPPRPKSKSKSAAERYQRAFAAAYAAALTLGGPDLEITPPDLWTSTGYIGRWPTGERRGRQIAEPGDWLVELPGGGVKAYTARDFGVLFSVAKPKPTPKPARTPKPKK